MALPERVGRYRLVARLGQGGMATVYRAEDGQLGRPVALKLMHPFLAQSREASGRFEREARAVARLRHPNILQIHDFAPEAGDQPAYLVAELIDGPTLKQLVATHGAPLPEVAAMIGVKLARALAEAHREGIVHRDVKPENVMVDRQSRLVLCDFGIARLVGADATMTRSGAVMGSPAYMSPEQADGQELDARSDLFSLGTVLYHLATGVLPFEGREALAVMAKVHRADHLPPGARNPRVPSYLERVIERLLRKDPAARFGTADEVAAALESGLVADGFLGIDRELEDYFHDPVGYSAGCEGRIVLAARRQAEAAAGAGDNVRAIAHCNRLLAWRPEDPAARALLDGLGPHRGRRWAIAVAALGALGLGAGGGLAWRLRSPPPASVVEGARAASAPLPGGAVAAVSPPAPAAAVRSGALPAVTPPPTTAMVDRAPTGRPASRPRTRAGSGPPLVAPVPAEPPPLAAPPPSAAAPPTAAPAFGELLLVAQPYCIGGRVDGNLAIDKGRAVRLPPGRHQVRCEGPGGRFLERDVVVTAGERAVAHLDFVGETAVEVRLKRGDRVQIEEGAAVRSGGSTRVAPGIGRQVRVWRGGELLLRDRIDIPPGQCVLGDEPLECRKP